MRKLLPILLALVGLGGGVGAGLMLRPAPEQVVIDPCGDDSMAQDHAKDETDEAGDGKEEENASFDYVKLNNQFVVPVVESGRVAALVILTVSLETQIGGSEQVFAKEPKLRDGFLQVLFDHANAGGFKGAFTEAANMAALRRAMLDVARKSLGDLVSDVLIVDIVRQDT
ncbi:MAG: flagellar basal body-associated FliL family protein [Rhodobacteraceae bacterium]|nr:flagellar basal body-associated FliL family protein [Paracoccaceae bacterium]